MTGAVLWDLDGTLVDSEEYHWRAWQETMSAEGVVLTREKFLATFGQRNDSILRQWLGRDSTAERIQRIADSKEELYRRGQLEAIGGAAYVASLTDMVPDIANVERYARTGEFIDVLRGAWSGEPFDYEGVHYRVREATTRSVPDPPGSTTMHSAGSSHKRAVPSRLCNRVRRVSTGTGRMARRCYKLASKERWWPIV